MNMSLNELVTMVLFATLILVACASMFSRFLHVRSEKRLVRMRAVCRICGSSFITTHSGIICQCPACDKQNLRRRNGRLG